MYRLTWFGALVVIEPENAAEQLLGHFEVAAGSTQGVAARLGVHPSTVKRWVGKLVKHCPRIRGQIEEVRENAKAVREN